MDERMSARYVGEWLRYKSMSPCIDEPLWEDSCSQWKQSGAEMRMNMSRGLEIRLAGLI